MALTPSVVTALGIGFEAILYGAYMVLFVVYLILWRRNNRAVSAPLVLAQILLFSLCTLSLCLDIPCGYFLIVPGAEDEDIANKLGTSSLAIFAIIDYLAQMILLYRCWIVWNRRWAVVAVPGFLALVTFGGGVVLTALHNYLPRDTDQEKIPDPFKLTGITIYSISLTVNALTTSLIVTKILLASRNVQPASGSKSHQSLRIVAAMLIESGLLMFAFQLVFVVLFYRLPEFDLISSTTTQIYGVTPTLLNIRIIMGSTYDRTPQKTRPPRFDHSGETTTQITSLSISTAEHQSQVINIGPYDTSNSKRATDDAV